MFIKQRALLFSNERFGKAQVTTQTQKKDNYSERPSFMAKKPCGQIIYQYVTTFISPRQQSTSFFHSVKINKQNKNFLKT